MPAINIREQSVNDIDFNEVIRRITPTERETILAILLTVSENHLKSLTVALDNQDIFLNKDSLLFNDFFPYIALRALQIKRISSHQFGTLMRLWGYIQDIVPLSDMVTAPQFVPLFKEGKINPYASELLLPSLDGSEHRYVNLIEKSPNQLLEDLFVQARVLPLSEQGFWVVPNNTNKEKYLDQPPPLVEKNHEAYLNSHTIKQLITNTVKFHYLDYPSTEESELIPSFGMQQLFLNIAFKAPVRINVAIGDSSVSDIRLGSISRHRDVAVPFPGYRLPKIADGSPAPRTLDFMFHDWYHCIRASRVTPEETKITIAIGDRFHAIQNKLNQSVKELSIRHKASLSFFSNKVKNHSIEKKQELLQPYLKKLYEEERIISILKKLRKGTGQLKFRMYDMDRAMNGTESDLFNEKETSLKKIQAIKASLSIDLGLIGIVITDLPNRYLRVLAHATLDAIKLDPNELRILQSGLRNIQSSFFYTSSVNEKNKSFDQGLLEGPVELPEENLTVSNGV